MRKTILESIKNSSILFFKITVIYLIIDLVLRVYEFLILNPYFADKNYLITNELNGYYHDVFKFVTLLFIYFPVNVILSLLIRKSKVPYYFNMSILFLYILLSFFTIQYFAVSFIPLDQSFYSYTLDEIVKIVLSSGEIKLISYLFFALIIILFFVLAVKIKLKKKWAVYAMWILWLTTMPNITYSHVKSKFYSHEQYYLVKNKAIFFLEQSISYFFKKNKNDYSGKIVKQKITEYQKLFKEKNFVNPMFPLLRKNGDKDVLGKYFELKPEPPHIVIVILESMGRNVCGPNARFGSFTPFLDSLTGKSLYWENFLSNAERTYGAIPNVIGSLPFGDINFDYKNPPLQNHKTLISYLKDNDYFTSFYYGGWTNFQHMEDMLKASGIDFILNKFDKNATKILSDNKGSSWGYDDLSLFKQYLITLDSSSHKNKKRLDILLTLSSHSPFMPPNEKHYISKFRKIIKDFPKNKQNELEPYKKALAAILYVDDAVKYLVNEYKKRKDYDNTIFIFVADHNLHAFPDDNAIRRYHIPLIIFSPLLKKAEKFSAVSSHRDIAPSLLALLKNHYKDFNSDRFIHMLGTGLDDHKDFRSIKTICLFKGSVIKESLVDKEYFWSENITYKIKDNLNLTKINDEKLSTELYNKLQLLKFINFYVYEKNKIIPRKMTYSIK